MHKVIIGFALGAALGVAASLTVPAVGQQNASTSKSNAERIAKRALKYAKNANRHAKLALRKRTGPTYSFRVQAEQGRAAHGADVGATAKCGPNETAVGGGGYGWSKESLIQSSPEGDPPTGWTAVVYGSRPLPAMTTYAVCAKPVP